MTVFYLIPFAEHFYSFTDLNQFMRWSSISVDNYLNLFEDDDFYTAAANTLFYVVVCVPISLSLSLLLAIGLNQNIRGKACCAPCCSCRRSPCPRRWPWCGNGCSTRISA